MGYSLTIDQGNSATKLAVWHDDLIVHECAVEHLDVAYMHELISRFTIDAAIYCSVADDCHEIVDVLRKECRKFITLDEFTALPIGIDYRTPETLGKDRIAAAVGAWSLHREQTVLVVDMGTAVTFDVVTANGRYLGGNIAPGLGMRLNALNFFTARLPKVTLEGNVPIWGVDTETAMRSGAIHGVAAEISYYRRKLPEDSKILLTGHMSETVSRLVEFPVEIDPHLVTKGLNCILTYNEGK